MRLMAEKAVIKYDARGSASVEILKTGDTKTILSKLGIMQNVEKAYSNLKSLVGMHPVLDDYFSPYGLNKAAFNAFEEQLDTEE